MKKYVPRGDMVVIRVETRGTVRGVAVSERSAEGARFTVYAVGPDVVGLKPGDEVLAVGENGKDYGYIPGEKDLFIIKQANVPVVISEEAVVVDDLIATESGLPPSYDDLDSE